MVAKVVGPLMNGAFAYLVLCIFLLHYLRYIKLFQQNYKCCRYLSRDKITAFHTRFDEGYN